mmetsp:Transcript_50489/g.107536  ORF Transcript_50489/g.107536 Transcript_50489/m.107536 type:complete len:156 (+) Transcript_50489:21-488(+)
MFSICIEPPFLPHHGVLGTNHPFHQTIPFGTIARPDPSYATAFWRLTIPPDTISRPDSAATYSGTTIRLRFIARPDPSYATSCWGPTIPSGPISQSDTLYAVTYSGPTNPLGSITRPDPLYAMASVPSQPLCGCIHCRVHSDSTMLQLHCHDHAA